MDRFKRKARAGILALCMSLLFSACASQGPAIESPVVEISSIELLELNLRRQTFRLHFDVANPNPFPLPVKSVQYTVFLESRQFASGETGSRFTVPARGESTFDISVDLDLMSTAASFASLLRSGTSRPIPYQVNGSVAVGIPFTPPLRFTQDGTILVR
ncbi:LEA type 2 family protein [Woeseia oceani]|nr:LEA type 2 family protein [Woeseia oceani]